MSALPAPCPPAVPAYEPVRVGVYGATGRLGRLTAPLLNRPGCTVAIAGRTESQVAELFAQPWCEDALAFSPSQRALLHEFAAPCRVVVNCAGPLVSAELARAAIEAGADFIDSSDGVLWPQSSRDDIHRCARKRSVAIVANAGLDRLLLDLIAATVARQARASAVDVRREIEPDRVVIGAHDGRGPLLQRIAMAGASPHAITAHVIAEATRSALDGDILASGLLDWSAFVPELFLDAMPFEELRALARRGFGMAMPEDILI